MCFFERCSRSCSRRTSAQSCTSTLASSEDLLNARLPLRERISATVQQPKPDDKAARTALGNDVVKALDAARVAAAIDGVTIYHEGEVTVTLAQATDDLGDDAEVSDIANGVAGVIFTSVPAADTVFVHDGNQKTIGRLRR